MTVTHARVPLAGTADPWAIAERDFPRDGAAEEQLRFLLGYAVLAPSGHNTQPWIFWVNGNTVELYADRARALPVVDPDDRELVISCGAALGQLRIALRCFGFTADVDRIPHGPTSDLLALVRVHGPTATSAADLVHLRVALGQERAGGEGDHRINEDSVALIHDRVRGRTATDAAQLFHAIPARRTNRGPFEARPLDPALVDELEAAAVAEGAWIWFVDEPELREAVADLVAEGDRAQWASRSFRREIAAWMHPNRSARHDGIPGYGLGMNDLMSLAGPIVARTFDLGGGRAARDRELATGSPAVALIGTETDDPTGWLRAGEALARILLRARADGVWASFLNQPLEIPALRTELTATVGCAGYPQLLLRLGYGDEVRPTPRRPVDQVVLP